LGAVNFTANRQASHTARNMTGKNTSRLINGDVILSITTPTHAAPTTAMVTVTKKVIRRFTGVLQHAFEVIGSNRTPDFKPYHYRGSAPCAVWLQNRHACPAGIVAPGGNTIEFGFFETIPRRRR
jgi:hypothetical protein